jgi:hypothetical protein
MAKKPPALKLHRWRITRIRATPAELIGHVDAPNEAEAIREAIRIFRITNLQKQQRLAAQRVK